VLLALEVAAGALFVIVNRRARRLRDASSPLLRAIEAAAREAGARVHETFDPAELDPLAREIVAAAPRAVVLAGGDGAYTAGVSALVRAGGPMPPVAFAPGGTVSTTARNWGMRGALAPYARRLIAAVAAGRAKSDDRPSLRVTDDQGGDRVGFIWGAGLVARFFDAYYASPQTGYAGAARIVARIFVGSPLAFFGGGALARRVLTPVPCEITVDGVVQPARGFSLMASSVVRDLGLHMQVLYRAAEDPERVHFVASPLGAPLLGPQMPLVLLGKRLRGEGHVDALAREVRVRFETRDAYVLDGDVHAAGEVTVQPGPRLALLTAP
jgi:diacylglycerol kinase (ATP)